MKKIYLAGPDVFRIDSKEHGEKLVEIVAKYNLKGMYPTDNYIDLSKYKTPQEKGLAIFYANVKLIDQCDAIIANLEPFRSISADAGTCFEVGYGCAQQKPITLYTNNTNLYKQRVLASAYKNDNKEIENFDLADNLMLLGPAQGTIHQSFEQALQAMVEKLKETSC